MPPTNKDTAAEDSPPANNNNNAARIGKGGITKELIETFIGTAVYAVGSIFALVPCVPPIPNDPYSNAAPTAIGVCVYVVITALYLYKKNSKAFNNFCIIACLVCFVATCFIGVNYYSLYNNTTLKSADGSIRIVIGSTFLPGVTERDINGHQIPLADLVENDAAWKQPEKIWTSDSIHKSKEKLTQTFIFFAAFLEVTLLCAIYLIVPRMGLSQDGSN